jgi:hypothetical protein
MMIATQLAITLRLEGSLPLLIDRERWQGDRQEVTSLNAFHLNRLRLRLKDPHQLPADCNFAFEDVEEALPLGWPEVSTLFELGGSRLRRLMIIEPK